MTNAQAIVEEMLKGNQSAEEIANKVVALKPEATISGIKSQIKGVIKFIKSGTSNKWKKYTLADDGISLTTTIDNNPVQEKPKEKREKKPTETEEKYGSKQHIRIKCTKCGKIRDIRVNNKGVYNEEYRKNYICIFCK